MSSVDIRIVREEPDIEEAEGLLRRYYGELDARLPGGFELDASGPTSVAELVSLPGAFLVTRIDGHPVGCGSVRPLGGETAEIKRMWIDPSTRGRGIGRRLLAALEEIARELSCPVVRLDTSAQLPEALALYRSSGYHDIPAYNDNPYADHWLEKLLV